MDVVIVASRLQVSSFKSITYSNTATAIKMVQILQLLLSHLWILIHFSILRH